MLRYICTRYVSVVSGGHLGHLSWWYSNVPGPLHDVPRDIALYILIANWEICLNVYNMGMLYIIRSGFLMWIQLWVHFAIGQPIMVIFRIGTYIYAFCIKFQCEFNCDAHFAIELSYYSNFRINTYVYAFCIKFNVNSTTGSLLIKRLFHNINIDTSEPLYW